MTFDEEPAEYAKQRAENREHIRKTKTLEERVNGLEDIMEAQGALLAQMSNMNAIVYDYIQTQMRKGN
jgi:hypothetical protein